MTVAAVVHPTTLLGKDVRGVLDALPKRWQEIRLLSPDDDEIGTLTEVRRAAAMVGRADADAFAGVDAVFFCGDRKATLPLLPALPAGAISVLLAADATQDDGVPVVDGVNPEAAETPGGRPLLSPHPGAVLLSLLLHPLGEFGLRQAVATLLQPASMYGEPGLEELYDQARRIVALTSKTPPGILPAQLAFSAFPSALPGDHVAATVAAVLGNEAEIAVDACQASIFHSFAASLYVRLADSPDPADLRRALGRQPHLRLDRGKRPLGPTDVAAEPEAVLGPVRRQPGDPHGYWIWAAMDNLTRGGALNAVAVAERALGMG